jgi:hypothetical protein
LKAWLFAVSVLLPTATMAQDYNCLFQYRKLERLNPQTQYYKSLYEDYMNRCAGQERTPHRKVYGYCYELRNACLKKNQLGEQGQGNCRRYREECRGQ